MVLSEGREPLSLWEKVQRRAERFSAATSILLGFIIIILSGTFALLLPFMVNPGNKLRFIDALFTATSATCVTGLVVVDTAAFFSFWGQLVILVLIQVGGLGYMTLNTILALALRRRIEYRTRLAIRDSFSLDFPGGVVRFVLSVLKYTFLIEGIGFVILFLNFLRYFTPQKALFPALFHSISAFCNAGFSVFSNNLENFVLDPVVNFTIMGLIILGGLGFVVLQEIVEKRSLSSLHSRVVVSITLFLISLGAVLILLLEWNNPATLAELPWGGKIMASFFQAVTPRTAGFNTLATAGLREASAFLIMLLMFIGASPGGTGGGVKTTTFALLLGVVMNIVRGGDKVEFFHRRVAPATVFRAISVVVLAFLLVFGVIMVLLIVQPAPFLDICFEVFSAFGTVGLSRGITTGLLDLSKVLLIITMYVGRVGIMTLVMVHSPREKDLITYPEDRILI